MHVNGNTSTGEAQVKSVFMLFFFQINTNIFVCISHSLKLALQKQHSLSHALKSIPPSCHREAVKQGGFILETVLTRHMK